VGEASARAIAIIQELTATPEVDKTYLGRVERITDFGAFIEIMPGCDGLLHVSEMANYRVNDVRDELKEGEQIEVKVVNIDPSGKVRLSRKAILKEDEGTKPRYSAEEKAAHKAAVPPEHTGFGGGRGGDRGGRPGGGGGRGGPRGPRR